MIAIGNINASKVYLGSEEISKIYLGNTQIWGGSSPTPPTPVLPYDAQVEYLKCSGTQYINTGIYPDGTTKIELTGEFSNLTGYTRFGCRDANVNKQFMVLTTNNDIRIDLGTGPGYQSQWTVGAYVVEKITIDAQNKSVVVNIKNGSTQTHTYSSTFPSAASRPIMLFAFNNGGTITTATDMPISGFKCWKNSVLIMDLISVRVGTTGYMYDMVSGSLFGNDGTGSFDIGNDLTN